MAAFGKIIGGGYPLAAVVGKAEIMEYFARTDTNDLVVHQVGTLNGNPIAATAGLANLQKLQRPGTYERLHTLGQRLQDLLVATLHEHNVAVRY